MLVPGFGMGGGLHSIGRGRSQQAEEQLKFEYLQFGQKQTFSVAELPVMWYGVEVALTSTAKPIFMSTVYRSPIYRSVNSVDLPGRKFLFVLQNNFNSKLKKLESGSTG
jgi:hypothetical protein